MWLPGRTVGPAVSQQLLGIVAMITCVPLEREVPRPVHDT